LTFGIADNNAVEIDSTTVADDEYARFTANGLESRSNAEVLSDIGALSDPMTTRGDIIYRDSGNSTARLAVGGDGQVLTSDGTDVSWEDAGGGGGNKTIWIPLYPGVTDSPGGKAIISRNPTLNLSDGATYEAIVSWTTPDDYTSITSLEFFWATPTTSANFYGGFYTQALTTNERVDSSGAGSTDSLVPTTLASSGTTYGLNKSDITAAINGLTISAGDHVSIVVQRYGGNASDTLNASCYALGYRLVYA
jgi:hypothetical protein